MSRSSDSPAANFIDDPISPCGAMDMLKVLSNPVDKVILEDALD